MPLSRLTQTLPLDLAEATSGSEASPLGADLLAFFAGAGALAAGALAAGALAAGLAGIDDLLDAAVAGAAAGAEPAALVSSTDFLRLFLGVAVASELAAAAAV